MIEKLQYAMKFTNICVYFNQKPCVLIRSNFDIKKQKQTGCALIRACAIIMSNTVFTLALKEEVPTMQESW